MDRPSYEFATGIPTHDAALRMLERFPKPNQIGERIGFLQSIGFPENRAREVEHRYWPATRGEPVRPILPGAEVRPAWPVASINVIRGLLKDVLGKI